MASNGKAKAGNKSPRQSKKNIKNHLNLLCISDWIIDKSEPKSDFEIVLNGQ